MATPSIDYQVIPGSPANDFTDFMAKVQQYSGTTAGLTPAQIAQTNTDVNNALGVTAPPVSTVQSQTATTGDTSPTYDALGNVTSPAVTTDTPAPAASATPSFWSDPLGYIKSGGITLGFGALATLLILFGLYATITATKNAGVK